MPSWDAAVAKGTRYDDGVILERVDASAKVGSARERDGVMLTGDVVPFPLVASLLRAAAQRGDGRLTVIDFGGSLGSSYRQCKAMLAPLTRLDWRIVEQPHFVARGRELHQTESLTFHDTLEEAAADDAPNVVLFSSVLQYLDNPADILARAVALRPRAIIIDRTPVSTLATEAYAIQYVPKDIFLARLPLRIFGAGQIDAQLAGYRRVVDFETVDSDMRAGNIVVKFRGALYERIEEAKI